MEPHLAPVLVGALHWTDPVSVDDPHGLALAYLRALRAARRPLRAGQRREPRSRGQRLAHAHRARAARGERRGGRARALGRRADARARLRPAARGEARLPHALPRRGRGASSTTRCSTPSAATSSRRCAAASASRPARSSRCATRSRRRCSSAAPSRSRATVSARRAARHRAVDGRAPLHAGHAAGHRPGAAPRESVVRLRPRAPRPDARRR